MWYLNSRISPDGHRLIGTNPFVDGWNIVLPGVAGTVRTVVLVICVEYPWTGSFFEWTTYDPLFLLAEPDCLTTIRFLVPIPSIEWSLLDNVLPIVRFEEVVGPCANISSFGPGNLDLVGTTCKVHFEINALFRCASISRLYPCEWVSRSVVVSNLK